MICGDCVGKFPVYYTVHGGFQIGERGEGEEKGRDGKRKKKEVERKEVISTEMRKGRGRNGKEEVKEGQWEPGGQGIVGWKQEESYRAWKGTQV